MREEQHERGSCYRQQEHGTGRRGLFVDQDVTRQDHQQSGYRGKIAAGRASWQQRTRGARHQFPHARRQHVERRHRLAWRDKPGQPE